MKKCKTPTKRATELRTQARELAMKGGTYGDYVHLFEDGYLAGYRAAQRDARTAKKEK